MSRRRFLRASAGIGAGAGAATFLPPVASLASALQSNGPVAPLRAGVGVTDLTPELGQTFFGYVRPDRTANGVAVRLFARALVLDDGATRVALLTVDLGASLDKAGVVNRLADLGYGMDNFVLAATHTHAGPEEWTDWLEEQMAEAVRRADASLGPAVAGWARGTLDGVNTNRSVAAHLANHGFDIPPHEGDVSQDPEGPDHPRDLNFRLLRVERPSGEPLAGWGLFAVHPTNFPNTNTLYSADVSGMAVRRFEASFAAGGAGAGGPGATSVGGGGAPVGILANGNEGDLISLYDSYNPHSCGDLMGLRAGRAMRTLWDEAGRRLRRRVPLGRRWTRFRFEGQEVEPGKPVGRQALFGLPFLGGAENGPSPFYAAGTEGQRRPAEAADPVHGRKIIAFPAPWRSDPELQIVRVGPTLLIAVAGEVTVEAGRRVTAAALSAAPDGVDDAAVLGLANDYSGYYTTPEEYDQQHYEGGHTVFGKWSSLVVIQGGQQLSRALARGEPAPPPNVDPLPEYPPPGGAGGGVGAGAASGQVQAQPPCDVARMEVADFTWTGGPDGRDRPVDAPFVVLERHGADGSWTVVDSDLGVAMQWTEEDGTYLARYEIARDWPLGTHRFRVTAARYELTTEPFKVVANSALIVRGIEASASGGRTRLVFRAQNPPPGVREHLRYREQVPSGGRVRFLRDGEEHAAVWDAGTGGWVARVAGDARGETIEVPDGALVDGVGNRSGAGGSFAVGEVDPATWPPDMAVGGTDRDWHGHRPAEADVGREQECAPGGAGEGSGTGGSGSGAGAPDDGSGGGAGVDSGGADATPATGGRAGIAGGIALGAALARRRLSRPATDGADDE